VIEDLVDDLGRKRSDGEAGGGGGREEGEGGGLSSEMEEGEERPSWFASFVGVNG